MDSHKKAASARATFSLPADLYLESEDRRKNLGYTSYSAYLTFLIERDLLDGGDHVRRARPRPDPRLLLNEADIPLPSPVLLQHSAPNAPKS